MSKNNWQLKQPIDAVIFDCDSTLSAIEGISVLAKMNHVYEAVDLLTEKAMAETGINVALYRDRLDLVKPTQSQLDQVADAYWESVTPDMLAVVQCLQSLGKTVYVVSAGILQAVVDFAAKLAIPADNVFAVDVYFDQSGAYAGFDEASPLASTTGKSQIVEQLRGKHARIAHIGDGMNDIEASKVVDRFIGYGGSCYRQAIADLSPFYITCESMAPVLPLLLSASEADRLDGERAVLYQGALEMLTQYVQPLA